jgi:FHS family L-fucose permease-like MFS transporter
MDISVRNRAEAAPAPAQRGDYKPALMVLTSLFFMWGVITSLNDILIPHLKAVFTLS